MARTSSGLAFALYRAYAAELWRWLNEDPASTLDGPNLFAYVANNPVSRCDLSAYVPTRAKTSRRAPWTPVIRRNLCTSIHSFKRRPKEAFRQTQNGTSRGGSAEAVLSIQYEDGHIVIAYKKESVNEVERQMNLI
jgi:hypothetical protein